MARERKKLPHFETPEEEGAFWETHSPLDYGRAVLKPLDVRVPKDRPITFRLTSEHSRRLGELASRYRMGTSTLSRMAIEALLDHPAQLQLLLMSRQAPEEVYASLPKDVRDALDFALVNTTPDASRGQEFLVIPADQLGTAFAVAFQALAESLRATVPQSAKR